MELPTPTVCTCGHDCDYHGNADGQTGWKARCGHPDCECEDMELDYEAPIPPQSTWWIRPAAEPATRPDGR